MKIRSLAALGLLLIVLLTTGCSGFGASKGAGVPSRDFTYESIKYDATYWPEDGPTVHGSPLNFQVAGDKEGLPAILKVIVGPEKGNELDWLVANGVILPNSTIKFYVRGNGSQTSPADPTTAQYFPAYDSTGKLNRDLLKQKITAAQADLDAQEGVQRPENSGIMYYGMTIK